LQKQDAYKESTVRIERVEVLKLRFEYPEGKGFRYAGGMVTGRVTTLVKVLTAEGITGVGAAYSHPDLVQMIIERHLGPHLAGCDADEIEGLWTKMYALTRWYGRKGAALSALGAVDMALWDLRGKATGQPLCRLLGATRDTVPAYASGLFWQDSTEALEREACAHRERGFDRVKMRLGRDPDYDVEALRAVHRAIGEDGNVMVDGSQRYSVEAARWLAGVLGEHGVFWFEEPFAPEDLDSFVALRPGLSVRLAAGENEFGLQGFRELIRAGALDIVQPDACRTGGVTEWLRIAALADKGELKVAPHTWSDAVALMANAHLVAATANALTVEVDQTGNPFIDDLLTEPLVIENGLLRLPDGPGLGVELNQETIDRFLVPPGELTPPGNYSDLWFGAEYWTPAPGYEFVQAG
jgi:D-galactarolactone cycloisomerase